MPLLQPDFNGDDGLLSWKYPGVLVCSFQVCDYYSMFKVIYNMKDHGDEQAVRGGLTQ